MISIFIPAVADEHNTNAQMLAVKNIVSHLNPELFHVTMFINGPVDPRIKNKKNVTLIPWTKHFNTIRSLNYLFRNPPDIFFYPQKSYVEYGFLLLNTLLGTNTKIVSHVVHEINSSHLEEQSFSAKVFRKTLQQSSIIAGNGSFVTKGLKKIFNIDALTIYDPIDERYFYPPTGVKLSNSQLTVLYVGSLQEKKRPEIFIDYAKQFPELLFKLAGTGVKKSYCAQLARDNQSNNIEFLGQLSQQALGDVMRSADIFLFPSISEGHPQVLGQAATCGIPVVAMSSYQPDFIIHNKTGFLADNDQQLQFYFKALRQDQHLRKRFSENAIQHSRLFNNHRSIEQWTHLFTALCSNKEQRIN